MTINEQQDRKEYHTPLPDGGNAPHCDELTDAWGTTMTNPSCTFDTLVVGESNRAAYESIVAAVENPASSHNPLLIVGEEEAGKTHMLMAAAAHARELYPCKSAVYVRTPVFSYEHASAAAKEQCDRFESIFAFADALFIDDAHCIDGQKQWGDFLYRTIVAAAKQGKTVVLAASGFSRWVFQDREAFSNLQSIHREHVLKPDRDMRIAIARKIAGDDRAVDGGHAVPARVLETLAGFGSLGIRELKSAVASISTGGESEDRAMARLRIKTVEAAKKVIASELDLEEGDLSAPDPPLFESYPKLVTAYLACRLPGVSAEEVGQLLGGADPQEVSLACTAIGTIAGVHNKLRFKLNELEERIRLIYVDETAQRPGYKILRDDACD